MITESTVESQQVFNQHIASSGLLFRHLRYIVFIQSIIIQAQIAVVTVELEIGSQVQFIFQTLHKLNGNISISINFHVVAITIHQVIIHHTQRVIEIYDIAIQSAITACLVRIILFKCRNRLYRMTDISSANF